MPVRDILEFPDPRLKERSEPVVTFDEPLGLLVNDLLETLYAHQSIGLCAPQLDARQQVLVMDLSEDQSEPQVFINPVIHARGRYGLAEERCLSVPDIVVHVWRPTQVRVRAQSVDGEPFETTLSGMPAVCLQHEMDHFDGKLLSDRINWFRRRRLLAALERRAA